MSSPGVSALKAFNAHSASSCLSSLASRPLGTHSKKEFSTNLSLSTNSNHDSNVWVTCKIQ